MERRIALLYSIMSTPCMGILPPGYPPGGPRVHCTAAMAFAACLLGWLLPTSLLLRNHCRRVHASGRSSVSRGGSSRGSQGLSPRPANPPAAPDTLTRVCEGWLLADEVPGLSVHIWVCLAAFAWLGCTLFGIMAAA